MLNPKKVVQTFFDHGLFPKTRFCDKKCAVFGWKLHFGSHFQPKCNFRPKDSTFFVTKTRFLKKAMIEKCFDQLFSDSAYVSDAKTTFEMFGMICFGVDSQTHTQCITFSNKISLGTR
jgi:hypothetical protein